MSFHGINRIKLGSLQFELLTSLWNYEMYGLEIKNFLKIRGRKINTSQLYLALTKLKDQGYLSSTEVERVGASRIYYRTTDKGKQIIYEYLQYIFIYLADLVADKLEPFLLSQISKIDIFQKGHTVVDLSTRVFESLIQDIVTKIGGTGRYLVTVSDAEQGSAMQERLNYFEIDNKVTILTDVVNGIDLPDNSVDTCVVYFTLNERGTEWMLPEISRILKPKGRVLVLEAKDHDDLIFLNAIMSFIPIAKGFGVDEEELLETFQKHNLQLINLEKNQGSLFFVLEK